LSPQVSLSALKSIQAHFINPQIARNVVKYVTFIKDPQKGRWDGWGSGFIRLEGVMKKAEKTEQLENRDRKHKRRWIWGGIFISILVIIPLVFGDTLLLQVGRFMAPEEIGIADVVILEGSETVESGGVAKGVNLLSSGRAGCLIVVVHQVPEKKKPFAIPEDYPNLIKKKLKTLGLREEQFEVLVTPVHHPVTLTEAKIVLQTLSGEGVKEGILLSKGFHTRRSFLVYRQVGIPLQIKIIPSPYYSEYELDRWWINAPGMRDFISEFSKLVYYQIRGYVPFSLS